MKLLGVKFSDFSRVKIQHLPRIINNEVIHVITANPEMLVDAHKNSDLADVLAKADIITLDSFGAGLIGKLTRQKVPDRYPGVDLMKDWLDIAHIHNKKVFLLGSSNNVLKILSQKLSQNLPGLILEHESEIFVNAIGGSNETQKVLAKINNYNPDMVFVAFGHGKQELWISKNKHLLPLGTVVVGVGGSFELISGQIKRAPCWMQKIGLEWIWRLVKEPTRFKRIFKAVVIFPIKVFLDKND